MWILRIVPLCLAAVVACSSGAKNDGPADSDFRTDTDVHSDAETDSDLAGDPPASYVTYRYVYVSGRAGVQRFKFESTNATLALIDTTAAGMNPSFMTFSPTRRVAYVADEEGKQARAFSIGQDAALAPLGQVRDTAGGSAFISTDRTGAYVFVANYNEGNVRVFPVEPTGGIGEPSQTFVAGANAHAIVEGPNHHIVYVPCLGIDKVMEYTFADGSLSPLAQVSLANKAGPRHIALHATLPFAYVLNELDSTLVAFNIASDGSLTLPRAPANMLPPSYTDANSGAEVQVAPSGRFLYASNRGHDSIAVFTIDQATGALSRIADESTRGEHPRHFSIDPSGTWLFVANKNTDDVSVFAADTTTGLLTFRNKFTVGNAPQFVQVVPDA